MTFSLCVEAVDRCGKVAVAPKMLTTMILATSQALLNGPPGADVPLVDADDVLDAVAVDFPDRVPADLLARPLSTAARRRRRVARGQDHQACSRGMVGGGGRSPWDAARRVPEQ